ncbi:hypothetical protein SIO57_005240 [Klebsiella pneumoniae]|nr:hypothetical protein [Klebsiella pneumoniae]
MALYKTGNPVPSSAMPDVWDNNRVQDEILNSEELEVETRTGIMTPTWKGVLKKNEDKIEETRQNLIPLSRQYMTLEAAQADIANIPMGSTTYYRSPDDSALAVEVINNAGTLEPTGRKMPSQEYLDKILPLIQSVTFVNSDEFDTDMEYPIVDKNKRILLYWDGANPHLSGIIFSSGVETSSIVLNGYKLPFNFRLNNDEFDGVTYARLDANNRIIEMSRDGETLTSAKQIGNRTTLSNIFDDEYDTDFQFASLDANRRIIYLRTNDGTVSGNLPGDDNGGDDGEVIFIGDVVIDGDKLLQYHADTGDITLLTTSSAISNILNVQSQNIYEFQDSSQTDAIGTLMYSQYGAYEPYAKFGRKAISFYGHSFEGNNSVLSGNLHNLTGLPVYNFARSGATSRAIALRNDAYRLSYTPVGGTVPASGSVDFVETDPGPLSVLGNPAIADQLQVSYAGVPGYVMWDGSKMTFTRNQDGAAVAVPAATELIVLPYTRVNTSSVSIGTYYPGAHEAIYVLWIGRNNINYPEQITSDLIAIVERMRSQHKRFVLCPEFTQTTETTGTSGYNAVHTVNAIYKSLYPENYCEVNGVDLLENFRNHYDPDDPDDVAAFNAGTVPPSLINTGDTLHPNNAGIAINAEFIYQFLTEKGWA